ncbi:MAG TPA: hypothetical protein VFK85_13005 [Anaeromyxobacteraceae bacterium]|nr:hypothetical protein [Anaeromyxobacteraceae bacterium]
MTPEYTYEATLATAQRIGWKVEDVIGGEQRLDFSLPFLPESLAQVEPLAFLSRDEKRILNQIRGHGYLSIFGLVEEFIVPFVLDGARPGLHGDAIRTRALLQFASEEAKHIDLFRRFGVEFERGFGTRCDVIGPPEAIASAVLAHPPLSVAILILGIEWFTQQHYTDSVRDDGALDPLFKSLLKHHWLEEAQHVKLDTLLVEELARGMTEPDILDAVDHYFQIGGVLDGGLRQQVALDVEALQRATGRIFTPDERAALERVQHQANRWTFIGSGMTHPSFLATIGRLSATARRRVEDIAPAFCLAPMS